MTKEEKLKYLDIATRVAGYSIAKKDLDIIISLYELILKKGGDTDFESVFCLSFTIEEKYKKLEQKKGAKTINETTT